MKRIIPSRLRHHANCVDIVKKVSRKDNMQKIIALVIPFVLLSGGLYHIEAQELKKPKSEKTAIMWSAGATLVPCLGAYLLRGTLPNYLAVVELGLIVGPSAGHFYAGQWRRGLSTSGLRLGIAAIGLGTAYVIASVSNDGDYSLDPDDFGRFVPVFALAIITEAIVIIHGIYDITTVPNSVRKYNGSIGVMNRLYFMPRIDTKNKSYRLSFVYNF